VIHDQMMPTLLWQVVPAVREAAESGAQFWPTTIIGWITALGFVGSVALYLIDRGKREEKINGWGRRVDETVEEMKKVSGKQEEHARLMASIVADQVRITEALGEAKRAADDCKTDAADHAQVLGVKVDEMRRSIMAEIRGFGERMAGVERELELGRRVRFNPQQRGE
jgi:hypothetical protein